MRVTEIMRTNVICCVPATTARKVAGMMRQFNTGVVLVVDRLDNRKLLGIVTDRDLCIRVLAEGRNPDALLVEEFMTRKPECCTPEDGIPKLLTLMADHHVRRVPVVTADHTVEGIITDRDLLENADIDPHELCVAMGRITASKIKTREADSATTAYP